MLKGKRNGIYFRHTAYRNRDLGNPENYGVFGNRISKITLDTFRIILPPNRLDRLVFRRTEISLPKLEPHH